jgi:hypothetical protein
MIENMFLGQGVLFHQVMKAHLPTAARVQCTNSGATEFFSSYTNDLKRTYFEVAASLGDSSGQENSGDADPAESSSSAPKRKRLDDAFMSGKGVNLSPNTSPSHDMCDVVPPPKEMELILDKYFEYASPWVPILHMATFYRRIRESNRSIGVSNLLRAIVAATPLHLYASNDTHTPLELQNLKQYAWECRKRAIASAIESHSKEATQALIVIAFDSVRCPNPPMQPLVQVRDI